MTKRPRKRSECRNGPRPCPFVSCRYHLAVDIGPSGRLRLTPGLADDPVAALASMPETCALDVADEGAAMHRDVAMYMRLSEESVRLVQLSALDKLSGADALQPWREDIRVVQLDDVVHAASRLVWVRQRPLTLEELSRELQVATSHVANLVQDDASRLSLHRTSIDRGPGVMVLPLVESPVDYLRQWCEIAGRLTMRQLELWDVVSFAGGRLDVDSTMGALGWSVHTRKQLRRIVRSATGKLVGLEGDHLWAWTG